VQRRQPVHRARLGILKGITRGAIIELAAKIGVPLAEQVFTLHDVYTADECFLSGTGAELGPVVEVDARPIGTGRPGPLSARFLRAFRELVRTDGTLVYPEQVVEGRA